MLPHLSTTEKCVVVSPGPVTGSATARRVAGFRPAVSYSARIAGHRVGREARARHDDARRAGRRSSGRSSPRIGTGTKSMSPIHWLRSAKAMRIASAMTVAVFTDPKPKPWLASPIGKRSSIFSIWIIVSPPDDGGDTP